MRSVSLIARKEFRHILRDPRSLVIALLMPVLMTFMYGYAINLDIKNIKLAILDFDRSSQSRQLAQRLYNSGYFIEPGAAVNLVNPEKILRSGQAHAILTIPPGLAEAASGRREYQLGFLADGSDANTAAAAESYFGIVFNRFLQEKLASRENIPRVEISAQIYYNPDLKSSHFFVPGLIAVILMMISALLTSVTIAREKEMGTIEQLLTAPVSPRQVIAGKIAPYIVLALTDGLLVILLARLIFGVPLCGSVILMIFLGLIYLVAALSLGILISTVVTTQKLAMMTAQLVTVLPSVMLSGYIFEIKNMPRPLQYLSYIIPARYFIQIIRGIMLKGSGITVLWIQAMAIILITLVLLVLAVKRFKLRLD